MIKMCVPDNLDRLRSLDQTFIVLLQGVRGGQ